ncbi:MAG TPA: hypothetical protein VGA69_02980 [Nitriliruptorales bacterium]
MSQRPRATIGRRTHRYSPLLSGLVSVLLAVFVLPSALNVPQSNPNQTLEFAPVPPQDDQPPPVETGNVASLSLGSSSDLSGDVVGGAGPGLPPPPPLPEGEGARPVTKRCLGDPPRQTEDPMSPPCVAHFDGDNGGATHTGVTSDEVRLVIFMPGSSGGASSRGLESTPTNTWVDLSEPPEGGDEVVYTRVFRAYQRHFNLRYQTYWRNVHFWIHYDGGGEERTPEHRRAQALEAKQHVDPFAVLGFVGVSSSAYFEALNELGIVSFIGNWTGITGFGQTEAFFRKRPGHAWSYNPSLDNRADLYSSYVCSKVAPYQVSFSGNDDHGQERVFGLLRTVSVTDYAVYGEMIRQRLRDCGMTFAEGTYGAAGSEDDAAAATNIARFRQEGVTTILFTGSDVTHTQAAGGLGWYPEWVLAGDDTSEREFQSRIQHQGAFQYVRGVTVYPAVTDPQDQACVRAYLEVEPDAPMADITGTACQFFHHLRQVFIGIQVAGPRLTPEAMDRGFHAIPAIPSGDPEVPACFYEPGDFTCVKDAQAQWWDPQGQAPGRRGNGCWRMIEQGQRYLAGTWPEGDVEQQRGDAGTDACTTQGPDVT